MRVKSRSFSAMATFFLALTLGGPAAADPATPAASPVGTATGVVYLTITNHGKKEDTLLSAKTAAAASVEIHETKMENDVMKMRPLDNGLPIAAGKTVRFEPGSYHFMLVGLTQDLRPGESFELVLKFQHAGAITVEAVIVSGNEKSSEGLARPVTVDSIEVSDVWSRAAPAML